MSIPTVEYTDTANTPTAASTPHKSIPLLQPPSNISVDEYLGNYISSMSNPESINTDEDAYNAYLIDFGEGALRAKIADVENFNLGVKGASKKRIPEKLTFEEVAILMMSLYTFRNIKMTERNDDVILAMYEAKEGTYMTSIRSLFQYMDRIAPKFRNKDLEDVIDKIERSVQTVEQTKDRNLFAVQNGIYDQATGMLEIFRPDYVFLTKIPVLYKANPINPVITQPDGERWDVESWITDTMNGDAETSTLIWQVIADCLQPNYSRHKSIWFYSDKGNNGKGTIGQLIKNLLGKGNYSSLSVSDFNHEFLKETLLGVGANIADENDVDMYIDSIKDYKASVTGDDININRKYEKPLRLQFLGTNIQMMNGLPKTKDKSDSFYRRLIIVPFMKSFTNNGERKYIKKDYIEEQTVLEYVLHKALNLDFEEYIVPALSAQLLESYKEKNNPVMEFWNELKDEFKWDLLPSSFLYELFLKWYKTNNPSGKPISRNSFLDSLRSVILTENDEWRDSTKNKVRSDGRMVESGTDKGIDEPLITTYGLDMKDKDGKPSQWIKKNYAGDVDKIRRDFTRIEFYRGFVRN